MVIYADKDLHDEYLLALLVGETTGVVVVVTCSVVVAAALVVGVVSVAGVVAVVVFKVVLMQCLLHKLVSQQCQHGFELLCCIW